jgi:hypothetical protein
MGTRFRDLAAKFKARSNSPFYLKRESSGTGVNGEKLTTVSVEMGETDVFAFWEALPDLAADVEVHGELVARLLNIVAAQQAEIAELRADVDAALKGAFSVKMNEAAAEVVERLAAMGASAGEYRTRVEIEGSVESRSTSSADRRSNSNDGRTRGIDVETEIDGIAKYITGLHAKVDLNETGTTKRLESMSSRVIASRQKASRARALFEVKDLTGSPLAHAKAKRITSSIPKPRKRGKKPDPRRSMG